MTLLEDVAVFRIPRSKFVSNPTFDHYGRYFWATITRSVDVAFHGSGKVDIIYGPGSQEKGWTGPTVQVVSETITAAKTYTLAVESGYGFEPRVYKGSAITEIEVYGPLAWTETALRVAIGAGVGAPIGGVAGYLLKEPLGPIVSEVVGAVLGGALGGGVGLLTGLGIIPVPQIPIPSLGAAPEELGAPARLGKYLITG